MYLLLFGFGKVLIFQERESYDMFGIIYTNHPHLKRILMPENLDGMAHYEKDLYYSLISMNYKMLIRQYMFF